MPVDHTSYEDHTAYEHTKPKLMRQEVTLSTGESFFCMLASKRDNAEHPTLFSASDRHPALSSSLVQVCILSETSSALHA